MALPELPVQGQNPWYVARTEWDAFVETELETRLSKSQLDAVYSFRNGTVIRARDVLPTTGDLTTSVQSVLDGMAPGDTLIFDNGTWRMDGKITVSQPDITLTLNSGAVINRASASASVTWLEATGARFTLDGTGSVVSPASWNGTNVTWTYAVILCSGSYPRISGITLENVNKVGIGFKDANGTATVENCTILGNYPAAQWTGIETVHFGITHDPSPLGSRLRAVNNVIKSCVQGICLGNFGTGSSSGTIMTGNDFEGCHNHALYNSGGFVNSVFNANTILNCAQPVVMTGNGHIVSNNTMYATGTGNNLHTTCNIQMRESSDGIVSANRLYGDVWTSAPGGSGSPAIEFLNIPASGVNVTQNNICIGNTVVISSTNNAIGIRVGSANTVLNKHNIVQGNLIIGGGTPDQAAIVLAGNASARGEFSTVDNNTIKLTKPASGIFVFGNDSASITNNKTYLECDSPTSVVIGGIRLSGSTSKSYCHGNRLYAPTGKGVNITLRGIYEEAGTVGNRFMYDLFDVASGTLTAFVPHFLQSGTSGALLVEQLPGAPAIAAGPGSMWLRTDGGAGTTLYIKETSGSSGVWRAI